MEVLPCSGVQYAGDSDCPQRSSGTAFVFQEEPSFPENGELAKLADGQLNESLDEMQGAQIERKGEGKQTNSDCQCIGASCCDCQVEDQKLDCRFNYFEGDVENEPCLASENTLSVVDTIESESPNNNREGDLLFSEPKWLEGDESVALWVKWRGKWQAGIRCARADWPLSTLKAKPTHDRKKYFVIFFPHTKIYSWADMLLVRSIDEFPHPIVYKNHQVGLKLVKDLTVPRRFIMQKLAVGMLNIIDQFHFNALTETARDVEVWKGFAMEASRCNGYSDYGRMLLRLHNSILQHYINVDWLQHSYHSWVERCQNANSAESVELLKESLQLGCACSYSTCCPETCDHVYLFGTDYVDAKDVFGKPMRDRFPYDENGRIILEEGYLVYECNDMCRCNKSCPNRILQNGVRVKLEVFKTEKKGWAMRAGEAILRGTFVCEFIGEVLGVQEADNRRKRYGTGNCSYFFDINDRVNDIGRMIGGQAQYVIDASKYGNVSRFINHSCSPNLVSHQVLIESMDCERTHIGLYASRDIALGEELTYDYQYELVPGEGSPCLCESLKCRGRLY